MQRVLAVLVLLVGLAAPVTAFAQVDGGAVDASADVDAPPQPAPDARPGGYRPALDDKEGCDCRAAGESSGAGLALLVGAVVVGIRRRPST